MKIRLGTRGSRLALAQAELARAELERIGFEVEVVVIRTKGDRFRDTPVSKLGKGVFVKEIERALLEGEIDLAAHSSKDMLAELPKGLTVAAYLERGDPSDCLISKGRLKLKELPWRAKVGTSSLRRAFQIKEVRPDLKVEPMRGNLDTRLRRVEEGEYDGAVVAYVGLIRMGLEDQAVEIFDPLRFIPAPGQGAIALEGRESDPVTEAIEAVDHKPTRMEVEAEKAFLRKLGGGCRKAVGAIGRVEDGRIYLKGIYYEEGRRVEGEGDGTDPEEVGICVAERILNRIGARSI